ncbi:MAG TPA: hypothetical protein VJ909_05565 [Prolixibacteraceae bacterium]|nr:hypothetical protein [Prolixibacteraceae bacterium]
MKTNTLISTIAAFFFVFILTSATTPSKTTLESESNFTEEVLEIEEWMASDDFWGISNNNDENDNHKQLTEKNEESLEIEAWMTDDEFWGL